MSAATEQSMNTVTRVAPRSDRKKKQQPQYHVLLLDDDDHTYTYVIDMRSKRFDTYLRLENAEGRPLAKNDDISRQNQNSRIVFTPSTNGVYRLTATSYQQRGRCHDRIQ